MPTITEQLLSRTIYETDGTTTTWDFSFSGGYLLKSHVKAYSEAPSGARTDIVVTEGMFTGPYQLLITPPLAAGLLLGIYRDTPKDLPLVNFTDETSFSEISLDTNAKQAVFIAAEAIDIINTSSSYDAKQSAELAASAADLAQAAALAAAASAASATSGAAITVFNANTTAYTRTLLDDVDATAARTTLGAQVAGSYAGAGANTDITSLGGNLTAIKFNPTFSPSTDPNTLDDYEEGTWTPVITAQSGAITSYTATGTYTKIGRLVSVTVNLSITNHGTGGGAVQVSNLPFAIANMLGNGVGRENAVTGKLLSMWAVSANVFGMSNYDNTSCIATGANLVGTLFYPS